MDTLGKSKQITYQALFFSVRLLTVFFCAIPLMDYVFQDSAGQSMYDISLSTGIISISVFSLILFLWFLMDKRSKKMRVLHVLEIVLIFLLCTVSVYLSGGYASYYKFIFLFVIVSYTIESGMKIGIIVGLCASVTILGMDLLLYSGTAVNPFFQTDLALSAMFLIVAGVIGYYIQIENRHMLQLREFANRDGLTSLYNHRFFKEKLEACCQAAENNCHPVSLIMFDLDCFKAYNDTRGHQQGDMLLKGVADILRETVSEIIPESDLLFRYGGDEYCVILNGGTQEEALELVESIKHALYGKFPLQMGFEAEAFLTISAGVSQFCGSGDSYIDLIARADAAMYKAKFLSSNRTELYHSIFDDSDPAKNEKIKTLLTIIGARDNYTYEHTKRVALCCERFSEHLSLSSRDHKNLICSAYFHDLGKIYVPKEVLISDQPLDAAQWELMKRHPIDSAEIIGLIGGLQEVAAIVLQHHERYDGTGNPHGLKGEEIKYLARILTIVDCVDAMTTRRPYQKTKTFDEALEELQACSGTHFDPGLVDEFIRAFEKPKALS